LTVLALVEEEERGGNAASGDERHDGSRDGGPIGLGRPQSLVQEAYWNASMRKSEQEHERGEAEHDRGWMRRPHAPGFAGVWTWNTAILSGI
jgi:hypothetical protein